MAGCIFALAIVAFIADGVFGLNQCLTAIVMPSKPKPTQFPPRGFPGGPRGPGGPAGPGGPFGPGGPPPPLPSVPDVHYVEADFTRGFTEFTFAFWVKASADKACLSAPNMGFIFRAEIMTGDEMPKNKEEAATHKSNMFIIRMTADTVGLYLDQNFGQYSCVAHAQGINDLLYTGEWTLVALTWTSNPLPVANFYINNVLVESAIMPIQKEQMFEANLRMPGTLSIAFDNNYCLYTFEMTDIQVFSRAFTEEEIAAYVLDGGAEGKEEGDVVSYASNEFTLYSQDRIKIQPPSRDLPQCPAARRRRRRNAPEVASKGFAAKGARSQGLKGAQ